MTRRPYSFNGDRTTVPDGPGLAGAGTPEGEEPTWHESLLGYCGGDARARDAAEASMREIGRLAGVGAERPGETRGAEDEERDRADAVLAHGRAVAPPHLRGERA